MMRSTKSKAVRIGAALAACSSLVAIGSLASTTAAHADPVFATAKQGVGSDTIQDLLDAYSGSEPFSPSSATAFYIPLDAGSAANHLSVSSWDAVPFGGSASNPGAITTKLGGPSFDRPNGSGNGINALLASAGLGPIAPCTTANGWEAPKNSSTNACVSIANQVDFARSSRGPSVTGSNLAFAPFARDGMAYAYFVGGTADLSQLTTAQLKSLYTSATGTLTVGSDTVKACLPQSGSGTRSFWETAIGVTDSQADAAATAAGCNGEEENGANTFSTVAHGFGSGIDAVIPFSAASWIAQLNGAASDRSSTGALNGVKLGDPDGIANSTGGPYTGTFTSFPASLAPNLPYYENNQYGRDVFIVMVKSKLSGLSADKGLLGLFGQSTDTVASFGPSPSIGTGPAICSSSAQSEANKFGFASLDSTMTTAIITGTNAGTSQAVPCGDITDDLGND